ncbi:kinetochore-associated Ndc80 complex subunit spc25 [Entomophthora muscae]|uniref:Kinetochore-associated Ndc80 complex subunit spc25 n=1 Tax=Entomophthora muscae TaxID=34485 RepID=A0ACC2TJL9_9FUNG|nr:kinetochore-associated Ndc80 complex subunit spc25 [Entomophthora muscae]
MEEQSRQSQAEYVAIERALCFTIKKPGQDLLSFKFTSISEKNPKEVCKVTLNISSSNYSFAECRPTINKAEEHLAQLNESRDILEFLVSMRQGFQDFYRSAC